MIGIITSQKELIRNWISSLSKKVVVCEDLDSLNFYISNLEMIIIYKFSEKPQKIQKVIDKLLELGFQGKILIGDAVFRDILPYLPVEFIEEIKGVKFYPITTLQDYGKYSFGERLFDILFAIGLILFFLPIFIVVPILVKISSPGPVFYISERIGKRGKRFNFYKFRSLKVVSSEEEKKRQERVLLELKKGSKHVSKIVDEKRLTPIGKFLRKTSIDELPQFFNVLKGDMAIVGPRPCLPYEWENYSQWQRRRLDNIPGCTGVWQVYGKGKVGFDEMVAMDMYYPYNKSVRLKLKLMWETLKVMANLKGDE